MLAATAVQAAQYGPGIGASVTQTGISTAKTVVAPYLYKFLGNLTVPDVTFDGGSLTNIKMSVPQPDLSSINLDLVAAENGIELSANDNDAHLTSDFTFKYLFISVSGKADIKVKNAKIDAKLDLSTQQGTPTYDLAPKIEVGAFDLDINSDDVDITLTGGAVSKIANILIPLLKSTVIPQVISTAKSTVTTLINTTVDQDLQ